MGIKSAKIEAGLGYSMEKFFPETPVPRRCLLQLDGLRREVVSFQLAYRSDQWHFVDIKVSGAYQSLVNSRRVGLTPVEYATFGAPETDRIGKAPGFYPDPLVPDGEYRAYPDQTRAIWFTLPIPENAPAGKHRIKIHLSAFKTRVADFTVEVTVVPAALPRQELKNYHWFHNDCLLSHYRLNAWSQEHWSIVEPYLRNAVEHGVNVASTPVFTPPLDTAVGTERPTVQLVEVERTGTNQYKFGFTRLERWIDLCVKCGMTGFAITPLSTQWGAQFAPKIVAKTRHGERKIFGWHTPSDSLAYRAFLQQFLPGLTACLRRKHVLQHAHLSVSDEPNAAQLPQYRLVREMIRRSAPELPVLEAISNIEFFQEGLIDFPAASTDHVQPFLDERVKHLWCYYCCGQLRGVSNRFMDFPSARNRILGWQLFKYRFEGFLHWGYNHWYSGLTDQLLDPYTTPNGGRFLPAGDPFVVYPGAQGPVDSLRWEVFREGLQDMRALALLKGLAGKRPAQNTAALLNLPQLKGMASYPRSMGWILAKRAAVNRAIAGLR